MRPRKLFTLACLLALPFVAAPLDGQDGTEEAERARRIARADSIREAMVQPPGEVGGVSTMDVIRAPFQVVSGALALTFGAGFAAYELLDETGVIDGALRARRALGEVGVEVEPGFIGSRSWPALVATWRGLDPFFLRAGYSVRRYELYGAGLELGDEDAGFEASGTYHHLREPHFWGVGPDSERADRSDYAEERRVGGAWGWTDFGGPVRVRLGAAWEENDVGRGFDDLHPDVQDTFDPDGLFGAYETTTFLRFDAGAEADFTRVVRLQPRGVRLLLDYQLFRGREGTDADFQRVAGDLRGFLPVTDRQTLAVRVLAEDHLAESGRGVPFTHLAELGDDDGLRGFTSRRFRDRAVAAASAEWRFEAWWHPGNPNLRVEGFFFVDHGAVGPSLDALDGGDFRTTPGLGLRLTDTGEALVEVFVAFGGDKTRLDLALGGTF